MNAENNTIAPAINQHKVAFVDLFFSWPPKGGASVDIYNVMSQAVAAGHEVLLISVLLDPELGLGQITNRLPFPMAVVAPPPDQQDPEAVASAVRRRIEMFDPDIVFVAESWVLTAFIGRALKNFRVYSRLYAYESLCPLDGTRFRQNRTCFHHLISDPKQCGECVEKRTFNTRNQITWEHGYADIRSNAFQRARREAFAQAEGIIVYNSIFASEISDLSENVMIIPGGVDTVVFRPSPSVSTNAETRILMAGRANAPSKGFSILREALHRLNWKGIHSQLLVTGNAATTDSLVQSIGWVPYDQVQSVYQGADICVVPSLWDEPFGLVALEAMACGLPVVASDTGGLASIVVDGETGFLVPSGDAKALAERLAELAQNVSLRHRMGVSGRERAKQCFSWPVVFRDHYTPIINSQVA